MQHKDLLIHQIYQGRPKLTITRIWRKRIALVAVWTALSNERRGLTKYVGGISARMQEGPSARTSEQTNNLIFLIEMPTQLQNSIQNIEKS